MPRERGALARLLQEQRERAGYSRAKLGKTLGIRPGTIEGWEMGRVERPPLHEVIRMAEYLRLSYEDLRAAVAADTGGIPEPKDFPRVARQKPGSRGPLGAVPLLEASFRLFLWKDEVEAAEALSATPDQVRLWRRGADPMNVLDYLSLATMMNVGIAQAMRSPDASDFDLRGAAESLSLRMAGA
jgi:DNA-binding XRE family transcriptional regulator